MRVEVGCSLLAAFELLLATPQGWIVTLLAVRPCMQPTHHVPPRKAASLLCLTAVYQPPLLQACGGHWVQQSRLDSCCWRQAVVRALPTLVDTLTAMGWESLNEPV